jgi:phytoene dehydrogenase-like protein
MAWDTIVIGSGPGGLTAAVALARAGQRVLVLEQHTLPGGWTHSFTLQGYRFSPGVHYPGNLQDGGWRREHVVPRRRRRLDVRARRGGAGARV